MKIRMKVKHLLFTIIGILITIPLITWVIKPQVHYYWTNKQLEQGKAIDKSDLFNLLDSRYIMDSQKWEMIQSYMIENVVEYDLFISPSFSHVNHMAGLVFTLEEKVPYIKWYIKDGPINDYYTSAIKLLVHYYETNHQYDKAEQLLDDALQHLAKQKYLEYDWLNEELHLEQAQLAINQKKYSEAIAILQNLTDDVDDYYLQAKIDKKRIEMLQQQGKLKEAYKEAKEALTDYEADQISANEVIDGLTDVHEELLAIQTNIKNALKYDNHKLSKIKGRILRSDGKPLANVGVYLKSEHNAHKSVSSSEPFQIKTDAKGYFEFNNVLPGSYQIALGLMFDQIDGWTWSVEMDDWIDVSGHADIHYPITFHPLLNIESPVNEEEITDNHVNFSWEKVEGAAYYNLSLGIETRSGGTISNVFKTHIKNHKVKVPVDDLYIHGFGISFSGDDLETADTESLLAFTHTDNRFFWYVEAYDKDGNLFTQSNGYRLDKENIGNLPFFYLKERQMTKADQLLLDKKFHEALTAYKTNYENNNDDLHSLLMITRIFDAMSTVQNETEDEEVIPYFIALAEKTDSRRAQYRLIEYYYDKQNWNEFHKWFERYATSNDNHLDAYDQSLYASGLMKQGKMEEANKQFKKAIAQDHSHRSVGHLLAVILYKEDSFQRALKIAKTYPERSYGEGDPVPDWYSLIKKMEREHTSYSNYHQELKKALDLFFQNKDGELTKWLKTTDYKTLKTFIEAVIDVD